MINNPEFQKWMCFIETQPEILKLHTRLFILADIAYDLLIHNKDISELIPQAPIEGWCFVTLIRARVYLTAFMAQGIIQLYKGEKNAN